MLDPMDEMKQDIKEIKEVVTEIRIQTAVIQERCKIQCEAKTSPTILKTLLALLGFGLTK
jgi:hypothetical protein